MLGVIRGLEAAVLERTGPKRMMVQEEGRFKETAGRSAGREVDRGVCGAQANSRRPADLPASLIETH
jgi:hypothetical protein